MKLNEAYVNGNIGNGIFTDLQVFNVPWKDDNINDKLDVLYYNHSGDKTASAMITNRLEDDGTFPNTSRAIVANAIYIMFSIKWQKLFDTLSLQYDPIANYDMTESETVNEDSDTSNTDTGTVNNTGTDTGTVTKVGTDTGTIDTEVSDDSTITKTHTDDGSIDTTVYDDGTITHTGTDTVAHTGTITNASTNSVSNSLYGFDSDESVPSDETSGTSGNTETLANTDTDTKNLTETHDITNTTSELRDLTIVDTEVRDVHPVTTETRDLANGDTETRNLANANLETRNLASTESKESTTERTLTRSGNIGVTTSQQLIESERALWEWNFFDTVFKDLDYILCLDVYEL